MSEDNEDFLKQSAYYILTDFTLQKEYLRISLLQNLNA